jgi:flagellar hook-associated protein 3 FlgL
MRVTDRMIFDRAALDSGAARSRAEEAIGRASTGQRLIHPGDDPAGAGLVALHDAAASRATAVGKAAQQAGDELAAADSALGGVTDALARAREIATQFSSAGYTAAQRSAAGAEVGSLIQGIVASLNTKVAGRYIMGGTLDGQPPFDSGGNYFGDGNVRQVEIAPGVMQDASVRADVAIHGAGGGVDVLATLGALQLALQANDQTAVGAALAPLSTSTDQVSVARTQAGMAMNTFDTAVTVNQLAHDDATSRSAHLTDADAIQANTDLALAQRALEAALSATTQGFKLTLLNYLTSG